MQKIFFFEQVLMLIYDYRYGKIIICFDQLELHLIFPIIWAIIIVRCCREMYEGLLKILYCEKLRLLKMKLIFLCLRVLIEIETILTENLKLSVFPQLFLRLCETIHQPKSYSQLFSNRDFRIWQCF